jgi:error-prone DNA polymerase
MEDETGIANVIVTPDVYERNRLTVTRGKFLLVEGALQNRVFSAGLRDVIEPGW